MPDAANVERPSVVKRRSHRGVMCSGEVATAPGGDSTARRAELAGAGTSQTHRDRAERTPRPGNC